MKKSEIYHIAQIAVLNTPTISPENKIAILQQLIDDERFALYTEQLKEKQTTESDT